MTAGGILGGTAGLLASAGLIAIPGIGPILAAGPIAATLTGVAVGASAGGDPMIMNMKQQNDGQLQAEAV